MATMAYGKQKGLSVMRRGFWGDVVNGPWVATGVECENNEERLTNKRSGMHHKSSCDIAYYNTLGCTRQQQHLPPHGEEKRARDETGREGTR